MLDSFGFLGRVGAVLAASVAVAGAVVWLAFPMEEQAAPQVAPLQIDTEVETDRVLVAATPLSVGAPIDEGAIAVVEMAIDQIDESFLRDSSENRDALMSLSASRMVPVQTPFVTSDLVAAVELAPVSYAQTSLLRLSEGMRAISMPVTEASAVAGLVRIGDRVDVLLSYKAEDGSLAIRTVLRNVRVIATDQVVEPAEGEDAKELKGSPEIITFELPPDGVKVLALARKMGELVLVLSDGMEGNDPIIADDAPIFASQVTGAVQTPDTPDVVVPSQRVSVVRGATTQVNILTQKDAEAPDPDPSGDGADVSVNSTTNN